MSDTKRKVKHIIVDKAPNADSLNMSTGLGFDPTNYEGLVDAFNTEFGTQVTVADIAPLPTINDVIVYMESIVKSVAQSPDSFTV